MSSVAEQPPLTLSPPPATEQLAFSLKLMTGMCELQCFFLISVHVLMFVSAHRWLDTWDVLQCLLPWRPLALPGILHRSWFRTKTTLHWQLCCYSVTWCNISPQILLHRKPWVRVVQINFYSTLNDMHVTMFLSGAWLMQKREDQTLCSNPEGGLIRFTCSLMLSCFNKIQGTQWATYNHYYFM